VSKDYYGILGVSRDASPEEIKRAYRLLARQYHPDVNREDAEAEERFKAVGEAYAVLSDTEKRRRYDLHGGEGPADFGFADGFPDFFSIFEQAFGFSGGRRVSVGRDLQHEVAVELEEVLTGATRTLNLQRRVTCRTCAGNGAKPGVPLETCAQCQGQGRLRQMRGSILGNMVTVVACPQCQGRGTIIREPCDDCRGRGLVTSTEELQVQVPPGIESGQHLEYEGHGDVSESGLAGSLYVRVTVKPHAEFTREGWHLRSVLPVHYWQVALGDTLAARTLEGEERLTLAAGTQAGAELRLRGKGLPDLRRRGRGDHIYMVQVVTPDQVSEEQRQLLEELARSFGEEPPAAHEAGHGKGFFARVRETLTGE
jgi:molecular chaperone DnaJ